MPATLVARLGLAIGDRVDVDVLIAQAEREEPGLARHRAYYLLSHSERTAAQLRSKLADDGFDEATSSALIDDLVERELLNDARYADMVVRTFADGRGYGVSRIRGELKRRGVDAETAEAAISQHLDATDEEDRALAAARAMTRGRQLDVRKLAGRLARRGFSASVAFRAARLAGAPEDEHDLEGA
jgi:regulatory protein